MVKPVIMPNTGKMTKDVDPSAIKQGDYLDLKGMDFSEQNLPALTTQKGNKFILDFGDASLQNQQLRVTFNSFPTDMSFSLLDGNGNLKASLSVTTAGNLSANKTALINWLQSLSYGVILTNTNLSLSFLDVSVNFAFSDYSLVVSGCTTAILKEALSQTAVGNFMQIASYNLDNSVIYWLTTQRNLPNQLPPITAVYPSVNSQIGFTCNGHGLVNNESVSVGGVNGVAANGIWTVTVIDANNFYLNNSFFSGTYTGGGIVYANIYGYGCIGIVQEDTLNDLFTFTPLLRSKKLNFCTKRQIYHPVVQRAGDLLQMYYTDNYNVPRVTYYRGEYIVDGAINILNPDFGQYEYATLDRETSLQVNYSGYDIAYEPQLQSGGSILAGNWRYATRLLTESLSASQVSFMTQPIPVYEPAYNNLVPSVIYGSPSTQLCPKINRVRVTGIEPGVFKFIELIGFYYAGESNTVTTSSFIIRRELLTPDQTEITLEHNGNEPGITFFDTQLANLVQPDIQTAGDMTAVENRLVLGDVKLRPQIDITDWVATFKYSLKRKTVFGSYGAETTAEFYNPENVTNSVGYPFYEWDRFYVVPVLKSGTPLNAFFAFDLRWVTQTDYLANPEFQFLETNGTDRRTFVGDDFVTYDLGTGDRDYYQYYMELKNVDWGFLINGVQARDLFDKLLVFRAENVREVLGSGVGIVGWNPFFLSGLPVRVKEFTNFFNQDYNTLLLPERKKDFVAFYSPDDLFSQQPIEYQAGDKMIFFSTYQVGFFDSFTGTLSQNSAYRIFQPALGTAAFEAIDIQEVATVQKGGVAVLDGTIYSKEAFVSLSGGGSNQTGPVIKLNSTTGPQVLVPGNIDTGYYHAIYVRERVDKYGSTTAPLVTVNTGAQLLVDEPSVEVLGGYVFTQQMWLKNAYAQTIGSPTGWGSGFNIISQNRSNANLRLWNSDLTTNLVYPVSTQNFATWIENGQNNLDQIEDNTGYQIRNTIQAQAVYDPFNQGTGEYISRKYYSELKPNGSLSDFFRIFLPLNFQDNPETQGRIMRLLTLNNNLFTLQERGFTLEYFNSRGQLISSDSGQILIGDGSVLSRVGTNLSRYGLRQRGGVIIGASQSGKDTALWFSSEYGEVLRFGDDGIRSVSQRDLMRTFFKKYNKWVNNANTPADGYGVSGVWDDANKNYYMTFKAWKPYSSWNSTNSYTVGSGVLFGTIDQGVPQIWVAIQNSTGEQPVDGSDFWKKIPVDDSDYYNVFTFAYSESKNGFTFFPYFLPNTYSTWGDNTLSTNPNLDSADRSKLYQHFVNGFPNQFYGVNYPAGEIRLVMNWQPDLNKKLSAFFINSNLKPERVNFTALFRNEESGEFFKESYLLDTDFTTREGYQYSPIKNILDSSGSPDGDTGRMEGVYCIVDIKFAEGDSVVLRDCLMRVKPSLRNFTS